ncbi:MAG: class I SAM-dependent methyltransferase [Bacteroidetes bacterium]|nr:class I SAM-dependent methyltransferase [Bacteroidota bacterium]
MITSFTAERVSESNTADNYLIQRHMFAYQFAARHVSQAVLEIGCGEGYGYTVLKDKIRHYVGIDKSNIKTAKWSSENADFFQMKVPQLRNIPSNMFDYIISFQVIEHIKDDDLFLREANRVLKKGGKLLLSTPNRPASFTRNPFHVREYIAQELLTKATNHFSSASVLGLNPSQKLKEYLNEHKTQVEKILKWDIFNFEKRLPRVLLRIPYNVFNQLNKLKIYYKAGGMLNDISQEDFILGEPSASSLDLYMIAEK